MYLKLNYWWYFCLTKSTNTLLLNVILKQSDQSVIKDEATEILEEDRDTGNLMDAEDNPGAVHLMDEEFIEGMKSVHLVNMYTCLGVYNWLP